MMLPNRSPILKRSIINSGRALPFSPSYNPAIITSLWQNTAKTTAVTIADPVRVQSDLNGSIDAIAPSDAARPLYARSPKSGIRNRLVASEDFNNAAWIVNGNIVKSGNTITDNGNGDDFIFQTFTVPANSNSYTGTVRIPKTTADANYKSLFLALTGGTAVTSAVTINTNNGVISYPSGQTANATITDRGDSWEVSKPITNNGGNTTLSMRIYPAWNLTGGTNGRDNAATGAVTPIASQLEAGAAPTNIQTVGTTRADITESGVDSAFSLLFDVTDDYLDTGVTGFGTTTLFADSAQRFFIGGTCVNPPVNANNKVVFAKSQLLSGQFNLRYAANNNNFVVGVRGSSTTLIAAASPGLPVAWLLTWDGTTFNGYVNSLTPAACGVGVGAEETTQNILIGAINSASPGAFFSDLIGLTFAGDRSLTTAEIASVMRYLASESGAVIS
jgi:hypothetical protein